VQEISIGSGLRFDRLTGMSILAILMIFFALRAPDSASAEDRVVSLRDAITLSLEDNPEIRVSARSLSAGREDIGIALSSRLPKVDFEERFMRTNNPTYAFMAKLNQERFTEQDFALSSLNAPDPVNDFQTSLSFELPLFAPKADIGVSMAKREFAAQSEDFQRKREEVAFSVLKAYLGVQTAKAYVEAAESGVEDAVEQARITESRYHADLGLYSDMLRAKVAESEAERRLVSSQKGLAVAKRALGLMLGLTDSVDAGDERPSFDLKDPAYYYEKALARKDLRSLEERRRNAENLLRMANAGYLPVVGMGGGYQWNDHSGPLRGEGDSWQMTAFLRWELFDGTRRAHERRKAREKIAEAEAYVDGLKKKVAFMVFDACASVDEARKELELARAALDAAEEGRRLVQVRYENALATVSELLDTQAQLDAARANVIARQAGYLTAAADLGYQSGTILQDFGLTDP
jgi:outer membrane protein